MDATAAERALVRQFADEASTLAPAIEALLCTLLAEAMGSARPTDGLLFEYARREAQGYFGVGLAVLIADQSRAPFRVRLALTPAGEALQSGQVCFGLRTVAPENDAVRTRGEQRGGRHHPASAAAAQRLARQLLADPQTELAWRHVFERDAHGWHRVDTSA